MFFSDIGNVIIPTDELSIIFQRGFGIPPTRKVEPCLTSNLGIRWDKTHKTLGFIFFRGVGQPPSSGRVSPRDCRAFTWNWWCPCWDRDLFSTWPPFFMLPSNTQHFIMLLVFTTSFHTFFPMCFHGVSPFSLSHMLHVWNIYLHLPPKSPSFVGKYSSTMVRIWVWFHYCFSIIILW